MRLAGGLRPSRPVACNLARSPQCRHHPLTTRAYAGQQGGFHEIKSAAEEAYNRASDLLPRLEQAQSAASQAREPAADAERRWQEAHTRLSEVQGQAHSALQEVRSGAEAALGGGALLAAQMLRHHAHHRLEAFASNLGEASAWRVFPPEESRLLWLPGASMLAQVAACVAGDLPYVVACVAVAMPPLDDNLRGVMLHWGVADGPGAGWRTSIPQGWHTSPPVSQPCDATAWDTALSVHAPVLEGQPLGSAALHSVVIQVPLQGPLEVRGGLKFVFKRTDGDEPAWIKPANHQDFFLDFAPAIQLFEQQRAAAQKAAIAASLGEAEPLAAGIPDHAEVAAGPAPADRDAASWQGGPEAAAAATAAGQAEAEAAAPPPVGWLEAVQRWDQLPDYPPQQVPSLSAQVRHLRAILHAAARSAARSAGHAGSGAELGPVARAAPAASPVDGARVDALLARCQAVEGVLQQYDASALTARAAQREKEQLWAQHKRAADEAAHLRAEISSAVDTARRGAVALRGRRAEVAVRDLEGLAYQLAEGSAPSDDAKGGIWPLNALLGRKGGRQLVFVAQRASPVAGMDATALVQVYLEGDRRAVQEALAAQKQEQQPATAASAEEAAAAAAKVDASPKPAFDTVVLSLAAAESFPDGRLRAPLLLHFGCVAHAGAKWRPPPRHWRCQPPQSNAADHGSGALPQVPMQRFTMTRADGAEVGVDPELYGACLRLPLAEVAAQGIRGVEFVFKTKDDRWLNSNGPGTNFYADLPLPFL